VGLNWHKLWCSSFNKSKATSQPPRSWNRSDEPSKWHAFIITDGSNSPRFSFLRHLLLSSSSFFVLFWSSSSFSSFVSYSFPVSPPSASHLPLSLLLFSIFLFPLEVLIPPFLLLCACAVSGQSGPSATLSVVPKASQVDLAQPQELWTAGDHYWEKKTETERPETGHTDENCSASRRFLWRRSPVQILCDYSTVTFLIADYMATC
jgi:hypothetical protein